MKHEKLENMVNGWFIGDFSPTVLNTENIEAAIKKYKRGDYEKKHHHKIATEITVIILGKVKMNEIEYVSGDIIIINANEATDFEALEDTITAVIKIPSVRGDKYLGDSQK